MAASGDFLMAAGTANPATLIDPSGHFFGICMDINRSASSSISPPAPAR
jgi:hypothetical protein